MVAILANALALTRRVPARLLTVLLLLLQGLAAQHPGARGLAFQGGALAHERLRGLGLGFGVTHVGRRYGDLDNSFTVGAYNRLDALVYYDFDAHWRLSVNMRNLTNARYIEAPTNATNNTPGAPFTVRATITARL